jgi:hypothetical protein
MLLLYRPAEAGRFPDPAQTERLVRAMYFEKYAGANRIPEADLARLLDPDPGP